MVTMATSSSPVFLSAWVAGSSSGPTQMICAGREIEHVEHLAARGDGFSLPSPHDHGDVRSAVRVAMSRLARRHHVLPHTDAIVLQEELSPQPLVVLDHICPLPRRAPL